MAAHEITDAAALAATTDRHGVVPPGETDLGVAWLDLRDDPRSVASNKARWVAEALSSCLKLQDDATLFVTTHDRHVNRFAVSLASSLIAYGAGELGVALIRGEGVLGRLEEFMVNGCDLRSDNPPHLSVREALVQPTAAWATTPPSFLRAAIEGGARVVIARTADRELIGSAMSDEPSADAGGRLTLEFPRAYRLKELLRRPQAIDELRGWLKKRLPSSVHCDVAAVEDLVILRMESEDEGSLLEAHRLVALAYRVITTGSDAIETVYDSWRTTVPIEMLDFGYDLRTANDWLGR